MIERLKKDITKEDVLLSIKYLKKYGIGATYSFMVGLPGESKDDLLQTIDFIKQISKEYTGFTVFKRKGSKHTIQTPNLYINGPQVFRPYPGGELYEYIVKEHNWKMPKKLEEWGEYFDKFNRYRVEDYPWVQNPKMISALQFYLSSGRLVFKDFLSKIFAPYPLHLRLAFALFYPFARIRTLLNFYRLPFEYLLVKQLGLIDRFES
jgi:radical SAM superfamily enzyme YgiQ (UPF0313 family)